MERGMPRTVDKEDVRETSGPRRGDIIMIRHTQAHGFVPIHFGEWEDDDD